MAKLRNVFAGIALSLCASTAALAGASAGSANPGSSSGGQTPIASSAAYVPAPAYTPVEGDLGDGAVAMDPTRTAAFGDDGGDVDAAAYGDDDAGDEGLDAADGDAAWAPPDPGPQYSDNSIASGLREQAARLDDTAANADASDVVEQARADGDADATMMQASGVAKVVESVADGAMALAGEVGGPELEPVVGLYGQAKGVAGAFGNGVDGNAGAATVEAGKALGETVGADSVANRVANGAAAAYDAANGEWVKAAGEATTALGDPYVGGMVQAQAGVGEGVTRYVEGAEQRERIDQQADTAEERIAEQTAGLRDEAAALRETATQIETASSSAASSGDASDAGAPSDSGDSGGYDGGGDAGDAGGGGDD